MGLTCPNPSRARNMRTVEILRSRRRLFLALFLLSTVTGTLVLLLWGGESAFGTRQVLAVTFEGREHSLTNRPAIVTLKNVGRARLVVCAVTLQRIPEGTNRIVEVSNPELRGEHGGESPIPLDVYGQENVWILVDCPNEPRWQLVVQYQIESTGLYLWLNRIRLFIQEPRLYNLIRSDPLGFTKTIVCDLPESIGNGSPHADYR